MLNKIVSLFVLGAAVALVGCPSAPTATLPDEDGGSDVDLDAGLDPGGSDAGEDSGVASDAGDDAGLVSVSDGGDDAGTDGGFDGGVAQATSWTWIPVDGSECASGARAGFGLNESATKDELFIFVQGGGACWNQGTCVPSLESWGPLCYYGVNSICLADAPGGTKPTAVYVTDPNPFPADGGGAFKTEVAPLVASRALDRSDPTSPFRNASYVFVPYCTGDLHAGTRSRTYNVRYQLFDPVQQRTIRHSGAKNMDAYLARLKTMFPAVTKIWLTGVSGGAFGATLNFERVQSAFPNAEVHLLADSGPFMEPTAHWPQWRDTWAMASPASCTNCDAGFPAIIEHLIDSNPTRRIGLMSYDRDQIITWFFFGGLGPDAFLNPPYGPFIAGLSGLQTTYDARANSKYFVVEGTQHVLFGDYGVVLSDGGYTASKPSRDGGTTVKQWVDDWATGAPSWTSWR